MAAAKWKSLHLMQASMQFSDSSAQVERDVAYACARGADVIGFTEVDNNMRPRWRQAVQANGYAAYIPQNASTPFAVKSGIHVKQASGKRVVDGVSNAQGTFGHRYVTWVCIRWHDQNIWVHEAHWTRTKWGEGRHRDMSNAMAAWVKSHAEGTSDISFWMGDLNINAAGDGRVEAQNLNQIFRQNKLLSIFDELHVNPPPTLAGHGVYDVIGCYRPDQQVKGTRYVVHPKQASDHSFVSAWYDIDVSQKAGTGVPPAPAPDEDPGGGVMVGEGDGMTPGYVDPDFYATGGNIDWSDYLDNDLYPLQYAYGDSDQTGPTTPLLPAAPTKRKYTKPVQEGPLPGKG